MESLLKEIRNRINKNWRYIQTYIIYLNESQYFFQLLPFLIHHREDEQYTRSLFYKKNYNARLGSVQWKSICKIVKINSTSTIELDWIEFVYFYFFWFWTSVHKFNRLINLVWIELIWWICCNVKGNFILKNSE